MIDKVKRAFQEASDFLRDQAQSLKEGTRDKSFQIIEDWLQVFPKLEIYGLEMTSFAMSFALSPGLEVELKGKHEDFTQERLKTLIAENARHPATLSVLTTIRTAYNLHRRTYANLNDPLIVKVKVRISPEIKVYIGQPLIE